MVSSKMNSTCSYRIVFISIFYSTAYIKYATLKLFGVAQMVSLGTSIMEVSSLKSLVYDNLRGGWGVGGFGAELIAWCLPSAVYLSRVVCELLHRSGALPKG